MKKLSIILISIFLFIGINGCKTKKKIEKTEKNVVEIKTPFSEEKYKSDKNNFRSVGFGESNNYNNAKEIAKSQARSDISKQVNVIIKDVTERYNNQTGSNNGNMFQGLSRQISESILTNIKEIDHKTYLIQDKKEKIYQYWVVLEVNTNDVYDMFNKKTDEKRIRYNKKEFEKIYKEELDNVSSDIKSK